MRSVSNSPVSPSSFFETEVFQESITREQMDAFVKVQNIEAIKANLAENNVFKDMLSEHFFGSEALNQLLIAAVEDNHEAIDEALFEEAGSIEPEEFEDPELEKLVGLLFEYHAFDPETIQIALNTASKYGRIDLIEHILKNAEISTAMMSDALSKAIECGWLEVVDLLLQQPASQELDSGVWCTALDLSHGWGFHAIGRSLIQAMGPVELERVKQGFLEHPPERHANAGPILAFIDECVEIIESEAQRDSYSLRQGLESSRLSYGKEEVSQSYHVQEPSEKRRRLNSDLEDL